MRPAVLQAGSVRLSGQENPAFGGVAGAQRVVPDGPADLSVRRALKAYLEVLSMADETQAHLWFRVDVYV